MESTDKSTDRIEKKVVLRAPRSKVWRAISQPKEFSTWFGIAFTAPFEPGTHAKGKVTLKGYDHLEAEIWIERVEPETYFSYRWHPAAIDPSVDYSKEPTTLVELRLAEVAGGTELTITETGFDKVPPARRADAFRSNEGGWTQQVENIARHVEA